MFHLVLSFPCADLFFHDSFDDLSSFYEFVHPLEAHFLQHVAIISTIIFKHVKSEKIILGPESRRGHLGHISGKGGTGRLLEGGLWEASGGRLGALKRSRVSWGSRLINCHHSLSVCVFSQNVLKRPCVSRVPVTKYCVWQRIGVGIFPHSGHTSPAPLSPSKYQNRQNPYS